MPEGHTIHRLASRHRELFAGGPVTAASPQGRFEAGAAQLTGRVLRDTEAYGKHLFHHYEGDRILHVHLGLYGVFTEGAGPPPPSVVGQVRLRLTSPDHWLELRGPAACELLAPPEAESLRRRLGADPLRDDADPMVAYQRIRRSRTALAALLLDQSIVAGAGLVYVSEVLFRAGIPPTLPGRELAEIQWRELWRDLCELMKVGRATGTIDTVDDEHLPEAMGRPPRQDRHGGEVYVYRRAGQPCLRCGTEVRRSGLAGRNSYWCPSCQPAICDE
ncbi:Fpg/Nei family DNA glycosylase [Natronosporangium hydrolyticum]|uniref:DNA-(apurinic or apyrimidinic site) lyase n=1 Tax=Natronosporangium hydrolyticum TaxID=2811111 RepID=A0A895Y965_9ACTN|nr:DNA-formamidopyrimidine glycosylase family protein [Natronosporangium hydrolyticum]QSB14294.1 Fpg/Nei family DNA glycosylase [Natronosporangium hydrolyticum]